MRARDGRREAAANLVLAVAEEVVDESPDRGLLKGEEDIKSILKYCRCDRPEQVYSTICCCMVREESTGERV